jgi:hypothetical protein
MSRSALSALNRTEATGNVVRVEELASIAFPSGTVYVTSADRALVFGGNTYLPSGVYGGASGFAETPDLKPRQISIKISGLDAALLTKLLNDNYHYAEINVYLGFLNEARQLVADPYPIGHRLYMSHPVITLGERSGEVVISAETLDIHNRRNSAALATPESQRRRYPGDTGMDKVRVIAETEIEWGGRRYPPGNQRDPRNVTYER